MLNLSTSLLLDTQTTCAKEMQELIFIYTMKARLVYWSTAALRAVLKSKWNLIIWHPPFWDYDMAILHTIYWGCGWQHIAVKVHGQSRLTAPRSPGSGVLVPGRHCWIFMAAQVWHGMLQTLVPGHSSEQLAWQEQLEPGSSGLPVL